MIKKIVLSHSGKMLLECVYSCNSVQELQEEYFPDNTLVELEEAIEFCSNIKDEYWEINCFLAGIAYCKSKEKVKK